MTMLRILSVILGLALASPAIADVAPEPLHEGLSPKTRTPTEVVMTSETVEVRLGGRERCDFVLEFVFDNPTDRAEIMEVGFPTSYKDELKGLTVTVDGAPVEVAYDHETQTYRMGPTGDEYSKTSHTHWLTWKMTFPARATRKVSMRYWVVPRDNSHWMTRYRDLREQIERDFKNDELPEAVKAVLRGMSSINTGYTLVTGAGWAGRIGQAVITVAHPKDGAAVLRSFHPREDFALTGEALTWTFTNFEPTFDLDIEYTDGVTLGVEIALVTAALEATEKRLGLLILKDYLLALRGDLSPRVPVLQEVVTLAEAGRWRTFYSNPLYNAYPTLLGILDSTDPKVAAALRVRAVKHLEGLKKDAKGWDLEKIQETLDRVKGSTT